MERRDTGRRHLPPLTERERQAVESVRAGNSACSSHLVDQGLISQDQAKSTHDALRRVARRAGIDTSQPWIGQVGLMIFDNTQRPQ